MQPVLQQGLPALGVNRNFPRATIAHGPVTYQGLNLPNLHTKQLITHIQTVLKYGNLPHDPTGSLIWACGELMQLEVGTCGLLFKLSPYLHVCMTETWLSHCWYLCIQQGIFIDIDIVDFSVPWEWDQTIMEVFLGTGYQESDLVTLNQCRMYLQASLFQISVTDREQQEKTNSGLECPSQTHTTIGGLVHTNQIQVNGCFGNERSQGVST